MVVNNHILNLINSNKPDSNYNSFVDELMIIYNAEKKVNQLLPKIILNVESAEMAATLKNYLKFTQEDLVRIENLFTSINQPSK